MAITSAADLEGMMTASAAVAATITGIVRVYERAGEIPALDDELPAIAQTATAPDLPPARVEYMVSQQAINHYWYLDVLFDRTGDVYEEQADALPFIPLVFETFNANLDLGFPVYVAACLIESYRLIVLSHGDQAFFAIRFLVRCRGKQAVDYAAA